ncbi:MAG TPA: type II toxin-antitoxin system RelE/ParE family toxin [Gammaproteobacteria bacterium]|nr:type II toxin-antitoxin system RelE/ParE family toxin [Gammaproteobacteria bacterium]
MAQVIWTEPALDDLNKIAEYIALDKPGAAKKLVREVFTKVVRLEQFPGYGRKPPELDKTRYREVVVPPCRIFYRIKDERVFVLYVMRSERQLRKVVLEARSQ